MKNELIFKVKDKVFDIRHGWGIVFRIHSDVVEVEFKSEKKSIVIWYEFKQAGAFLSFTEYNLQGFSQERPETLPEKGQVVWVRDDEDDEWLISHFVEKQGRYYGTTDGDPFSGIVETGWKYLTTENPYKNEN